MSIRVGQAHGFKVLYNTQHKEFVLEDEEGREVAKGSTQQEVEDKAKKIRKASIAFPIKVVKVGIGSVIRGKITSFNHDTGEYWFVDEKGNRVKSGHYRSGQYFEQNEANVALMERFLENERKKFDIEKERQALVQQLTGGISARYFEEKIKQSEADNA